MSEDLDLILKSAASALTGIGVITLVLIRWKGKQLIGYLLGLDRERNDEERDEADEDNRRFTFRRKQDLLIERFLNMTEKQTEFRERLLSLHMESLQILKNQQAMIESSEDKQKQILLLVDNIHDYSRDTSAKVNLLHERRP